MALAAHKFNIELGAALSGTFDSSLDRGKEKLGALGTAVRNLDVQAKAANSFVKLRGETDQAKNSWQAAEQQVKMLALEMKKSAHPTAELSQKFQEAKLTAQTAKHAYQEKKLALENLSTSIKKAGMSTEQLALKQTKLGASVVALKTQYAGMQNLMQQQSALAAKARVAMGSLMRIGMTAAVAFGVPIKKAIDAQEAMVNLGNVTNIVRNEGLGLLRGELENLTRTLPFTFQELTKLATMGARIGIKDTDLKSWTEATGKMALVLGMSTDEMGDAVAKLQGAFKLTTADLEHMGDVVNYFGDTSRVESASLMKTMVTMAGAAKQFGLSVEQTAALTTAFAKMGYDAEKAGSVVTQMLPKLGLVATETNKTMAEAAKKIGIIPATLKQMMKENPEKALVYALEKIKAVPVHEQAGALNAIFGQRVQAEASQLASRVDLVSETFAELANKTKIAGGLQQDYEALIGTTKEQMKLFRNSFEQLGIAIGDAVLPAFTSMMQSMTGFFQKVTDFSKEHPKIFSFLTKITALILGVAAGAAALKMAFFGVGAAIKGVGVIFKGLMLVAQLNPVILAVTAIAVAATVVIKYWMQVKEFFVNLWEWINEKFKSIGEFFTNIGIKVGGFFKKIWPFGDKDAPTKIETENKIANTELKLPANKTIANSNNKTLTNNMTINITGTNDAKNIADEISKAVKQTTLDAMYDTNIYVG
ncbi:MAG: phage tail tape measure protein [Puniceicoccales bacterium]|jgi:TP901 family phage tail tape measure protein|nr:phage tail tape measure protein [Puniceicoccales bacterium]